VIVDGRLTKDYGGGVSQVSTTTFNAAFFSGVRIDDYLPHSFYISRYPEGREATVSWPDVDQKWTNDTGAGILIQAGVSGNAITVTFHGTKVWDIESVKGPRRNVVQPRTIVDNRAGCVPQSPSPGFDVTVARVFKKNGQTVKTSTFTTHYIPEDNVRCTHPQAG
jgi:vancomycin resistance protein YoaR